MSCNPVLISERIFLKISLNFYIILLNYFKSYDITLFELRIRERNKHEES